MRLLVLDGVQVVRDDDLSRCIDQEFRLADDSLGQAYVIIYSLCKKEVYSATIINQLERLSRSSCNYIPIRMARSIVLITYNHRS